DSDAKGLLEHKQIAAVDAFALALGIRVLWAGGITPEQAYEFGKLGVFGIYVTTAVSIAAPVGESYKRDTGLASEKEPTFAGVRRVKTLLEAGFLSDRLAIDSRGGSKAREALREQIDRAGLDEAALATVLPTAWRAWW